MKDFSSADISGSRIVIAIEESLRPHGSAILALQKSRGFTEVAARRRYSDSDSTVSQ
jgi:hypothetical protein